MDWELYFRLGQLSPVACVGVPCSLFRVHDESDTTHLTGSGARIREPYLLLRTNLARLGRDDPQSTNVVAWRSKWADTADNVCLDPGWQTFAERAP